MLLSYVDFVTFGIEDSLLHVEWKVHASSTRAPREKLPR